MIDDPKDNDEGREVRDDEDIDEPDERTPPLPDNGTVPVDKEEQE